MEDIAGLWRPLVVFAGMLAVSCATLVTITWLLVRQLCVSDTTGDLTDVDREHESQSARSCHNPVTEMLGDAIAKLGAGRGRLSITARTDGDHAQVEVKAVRQLSAAGVSEERTNEMSILVDASVLDKSVIPDSVLRRAIDTVISAVASDVSSLETPNTDMEI